MSRSVLHSVAIAVSLALAIFALATQRTLLRGAEEMRVSDAAFDAGRLEVAVRHARRAAAAYVPGADHVTAAYARLRAVAVGAERARDPELALTAWRAVRAAALESRHVWTPRSRELEQADLNVARLLGPLGSEPRGRLGAAPTPRPRWVMTLALGFCAAWVGLGMTFWRGMTASGHWVLARTRLPALLFFFGIIAMGLALSRA
jgi:hypothetical protein